MRSLALIFALSGCFAANKIQHRDTSRACQIDGFVMAASAGLAADSVLRTDRPNEYLIGWSIGMAVLTADIVTELVTR